MTAEEPPTEGAFPIRALLEVDLDAQPIQGILSAPGEAPRPFVGWLGLTAALELCRPGLRSGQEKITEGSTMRSGQGRP
jgi:hypothetical protein